MTHREAMAIALTELGLGKREIWRRLEFADREAGYFGDKTLALKPGVSEQDHIEAIKTGYRKFHALSEGQKLEVFVDMQKRHRERIKGN